MPIDTSMYREVATPDVGNALNSYGAVIQARNANQQNKLLHLQTQGAQRDFDTQNALRDAYSRNTNADGSLNYSGVSADLAAHGGGAAIPGVAKSALEMRNMQIDQATKKTVLQRDYAAMAAADPTNAARYLQAYGAVSGDDVTPFVQHIGTMTDPKQISAFFQKISLDANGQLTFDHNAATEEKEAAALAETRRHNGVTEGIAKDGNALRGKALEALGAKPPKPITESQGNAGLFGARAAEASAVLDGLDGKYNTATLSAKQGAEGIPIIGGMIGAAVNTAVSPEVQKAEQAQRNFVTAVLRKESGASISQSEFDTARKQYFNQVGDSAEVKAQKRANRETAIRGLKVMAGPAADAMSESAPQQPNLQKELAIKFLGFE